MEADDDAFSSRVSYSTAAFKPNNLLKALSLFQNEQLWMRLGNADLFDLKVTQTLQSLGIDPLAAPPITYHTDVSLLVTKYSFFLY